MTRGLTGTVAAAVAAEQAARTVAIELDFPSGMARWNASPMDIVIDGATFLGVGMLGSISVTEESAELRAYGLTVVLSGIPRDAITLALIQGYQGRRGWKERERDEDEQAAAECRRVLSAFFAEMTQWEQYMEQAGFEGAEAVPRLLTIWEKYVSEKPRPGYRPLGLSYSAQGTYNGEEFLDAEQITKNKLYIYTREKNTSFDRRFLMKRVGEGWMIDAVQERLDGCQTQRF